MTKAELLTDLASKTDVLNVGTPELVNTIDNVTRYNVPVVLDKGNNLVLGASQTILVIDEGVTGEESAYYNIKKNFSQPEDPFNDELQAHADSFEGVSHAGATILKVVLNDVNPQRKSGIATAYKDDGSKVTALLFKDNGTWQTQILS